MKQNLQSLQVPRGRTQGQKVNMSKGAFQTHTQTLARDKRKASMKTGIQSTSFKMKNQKVTACQLHNTSTIKGSPSLNWKWHSTAVDEILNTVYFG